MNKVSSTPRKKIPRKRLYWTSQIVGWSLYVFLLLIINELDSDHYPVSIKMIFNLGTTFILGILSTHLYRAVIIKLDWLRLKIIELIPRLLGASLAFSLFYNLIHRLISDLVIDNFGLDIDFVHFFESVLSVWVVFLVWSLFYFLFLFIQKYRSEEIKNLKWQAMKNEIELNKLKSQLNPHFIFNSMNIIRALIEEDPAIAKASITRLSNILRSSMLMGRKRVIRFSEELQLVHDYLNLEKTRFEERLNLDFNVDDACLSHNLPPMILQTLVENGIKHGVSKLQEGGVVKVDAYIQNNDLIVEIRNSGYYKQDTKSEVGFGLINTKQRLQLLYGDRAAFSIQNIEGNMVLSKLIIPSETIKINIDNESFSN